jgi:hypothetical protein
MSSSDIVRESSNAAAASAASTGSAAAPPSLRWIRIAVVYFVLAVMLGVGMSMSEDFRLKGLHVHLNLLGWVSLSITGFIYDRVPAAAASRAASVHFWLYVLALPVMMVGLCALLLGHQGGIPAIAAGSLCVLAAIVTFAANVLWHTRASARRGLRETPAVAGASVTA